MRDQGQHLEAQNHQVIFNETSRQFLAVLVAKNPDILYETLRQLQLKTLSFKKA